MGSFLHLGRGLMLVQSPVRLLWSTNGTRLLFENRDGNLEDYTGSIDNTALPHAAHQTEH